MIAAGGWLPIVIAFAIYVFVAFRVTMKILGIGFLRALLVTFLTNVVWKVLSAVIPAILGK